MRAIVRATRLIFIEQPGSWWAYLDGAIQLHLLLNVTNESETDVLIVSRVQVRLAGWTFLFSKWQDCMGVEIDEERLALGYVGIPLPARTTTLFRIMHRYESERPKPNQSIKCRLRVADEHGRLHYARLTVPSR